MGPTHPRRRRPRPIRPDVLARLFPPHALRCRMSQRRRLRRLLPHQNPAALPFAVAGQPRPLRRPGRRMPQTRHGSDRTHRPARRPSRHVPGPPRLDRGGRRGAQTAARRHARMVAHLRARSLQFRVHDRGHQGDRGAIQGGRHLQQSLERQRHVLLRTLPEELPRRNRIRTAAHHQSAGSRPPRLHGMEAAAPVRIVAAVGRRDPQDSIPPRATSPIPAAARSASSI